MQNEYHFENSNKKKGNEEIVAVELWDVVYTVLRKWPLLLAGLLCGAVMLGAFGAWQGRRSSEAAENNSIEDRIASAREGLGEARAAEIEGMYTQYREYVVLQSMLREQYAEYENGSERVDNSSMKTLQFLCVSEESGSLGVFDPKTVLNEDVCREIGKIIGEETSAKEAEILSGNRVFITDNRDYKTVLSSEENTVEISPSRYTLTVRIIGDDKSQCDQIQAIIEKKMMSLRQAYVDAGGKLEMSLYASEYSNSAATFMKDILSSWSVQMRNATDNLYLLQQNTIDKLDNDAKAYYELLQEHGRTAADAADEEAGTQAEGQQPASSKRLVNKKYVVVGALAGVFLAALLVLLQYILTHAIQSKESFTFLCRIPLIASVYKKGASSTGLGVELYKLFHSADELTSGKTSVISQDIGIELKKKNAGSLYLLLADDTEELSSFAQKLSDNIQSQCPGLTVECGDPLNTQGQMKALSDADSAVVLAELKKARREDVIQQLQMCRRYQVPVVGAVTLEVV